MNEFCVSAQPKKWTQLTHTYIRNSEEMKWKCYWPLPLTTGAEIDANGCICSSKYRSPATIISIVLLHQSFMHFRLFFFFLFFLCVAGDEFIALDLRGSFYLHFISFSIFFLLCFAWVLYISHFSWMASTFGSIWWIADTFNLNMK